MNKIANEQLTQESRNKIVIALAATFRWKSTYTDEYVGDQENMVVISQLIAYLSIEQSATKNFDLRIVA